MRCLQCSMLIGLLLFLGCQPEREEKLPSEVMEKRDFVFYVEGRCELQSKSKFDVRIPRIPDKIRSRISVTHLAEEGINVKEGDLIAAVSSMKLPERVRSWQAEYKISKARMEEVQKNHKIEKNRLESEIKKKEITLAQKQTDLKRALIFPGSTTRLTAAMDLAEAQKVASQSKEDLDFQKYLMDKKLASESDFIQKKLKYLESMSDLKSKELEIEILKLGPDVLEIAELEKSVAQAKIDLQQAKNDLKYKVMGFEADITRVQKRVLRFENLLKKAEEFEKVTSQIRSPGKGIVLYKQVWSGSGMEKVKVGMRVWRQQSILSIQDIQDMKVVVEIPENRIASIQEKQKAEITIDSIPGQKFFGQVTEIENVAFNPKGSSNSEESQKERKGEKIFRVTVEMAENAKGIKPGLTGTVRIITGEAKQQLSIPREAVIRKDGKSFVFVREGQQWQTQEVTTGADWQDRLIVTSGLQAGNEIVSFPTASLMPEEEVHGDLVQVSRKNMKVKLHETGFLHPIESYDIYAPISGDIAKIIPDGSEVKTGETILVMEKEENEALEEILLQLQSFEVEKQERVSELELAKQNQDLDIKKVEEEVKLSQFWLDHLKKQPLPHEVQKVVLETEKASFATQAADADYQLGLILYRKNLISEADLSKRLLESKSKKSLHEIAQLKEKIARKGAPLKSIQIAEEKLSLAKKKYEQTKANALQILHKHKISIQTSQARIDEKQYQVDYIENAQKEGVIKAPGNGIVRYVSGSKGLPEVGKNYFAGERIIDLVNENQMVVKSKVNEVDRRSIKIGQTAQIWLPAFPEKEFTGEVFQISQIAVDRSEGKGNSMLKKSFSGVMIFEMSIKINERDSILKAGMSASLFVELKDKPNVLAIPREAIFYQNDKPFVYLRDGQQLRSQEIQIGIKNANYVEITSGLNEGQTLLFPNRKKKLTN